jgi:hypothetical protein
VLERESCFFFRRNSLAVSPRSPVFLKFFSTSILLYPAEEAIASMANLSPIPKSIDSYGGASIPCIMYISFATSFSSVFLKSSANISVI